MIYLYVTGPEMPHKIAAQFMVPLGNGQAICGGYLSTKDLDETTDLILFFTCSNMNCQIETLEQKLYVRASHFLMIPIPDTISGCVSEGIGFSLIDNCIYTPLFFA